MLVGQLWWRYKQLQQTGTDQGSLGLASGEWMKRFDFSLQVHPTAVPCPPGVHRLPLLQRHFPNCMYHCQIWGQLWIRPQMLQLSCVTSHPADCWPRRRLTGIYWLFTFRATLLLKYIHIFIINHTWLWIRPTEIFYWVYTHSLQRSRGDRKQWYNLDFLVDHHAAVSPTDFCKVRLLAKGCERPVERETNIEWADYPRSRPTRAEQNHGWWLASF
jgi:hypothetical protein